MTELEKAQGRVEFIMAKLRTAEAKYHSTVQHGCLAEMNSVLSECQRIRAQLIEAVKQRDDMTGGDNHESG